MLAVIPRQFVSIPPCDGLETKLIRVPAKSNYSQVENEVNISMFVYLAWLSGWQEP